MGKKMNDHNSFFVSTCKASWKVFGDERWRRSREQAPTFTIIIFQSIEMEGVFKVGISRLYKKTQVLNQYSILSQMRAYLINMRSNEEMIDKKDDELDEIHVMKPRWYVYDAKWENPKLRKSPRLYLKELNFGQTNYPRIKV